MEPVLLPPKDRQQLATNVAKTRMGIAKHGVKKFHSSNLHLDSIQLKQILRAYNNLSFTQKKKFYAYLLSP